VADKTVAVADLFIKGKSFGPHAFVMNLRENGKPVPGVHFDDMGKKTVRCRPHLECDMLCCRPHLECNMLCCRPHFECDMLCCCPHLECDMFGSPAPHATNTRAAQR